MRIGPVFLKHQLGITQRNLTGTRSDDVQRDIDSAAMQVRRPATLEIGKQFAPDQSQEQSLKYVFCIRRISRYPKSRSVYQFVILEECFLYLGRLVRFVTNFNWQDQTPRCLFCL